MLRSTTGTGVRRSSTIRGTADSGWPDAPVGLTKRSPSKWSLFSAVTAPCLSLRRPCWCAADARHMC